MTPADVLLGRGTIPLKLGALRTSIRLPRLLSHALVVYRVKPVFSPQAFDGCPSTCLVTFTTA
jgi:hypothetical protein